MQYILLEQAKIWDLEEAKMNQSPADDNGYISSDYGIHIIEEMENECGIECKDSIDLEENESTYSIPQDCYLYKVVDKQKFLFAAMKYNINYTVVNPFKK